MKRIILLLSLLLLTVSVANAQTYVFKTSDNATTIDGNLSDWDNATVLTWMSPNSNVDPNFQYFLHSDSYYFFGAKIYDNDNINDDILRIYLNDTQSTYRLDLSEGSNSASAFKYVNDSWTPVTFNASVFYTSSQVTPYTYIELSIPKYELNNSKTIYFYLEYQSTHIRDVFGWFPTTGVFNNTSTWELLEFSDRAERMLNLTILDRNGIPVNFTNGNLLIEVRYSLNNTHIVTLTGHSNTSIPLPSENVTLLIRYLNLPILEKSYDLTLSNISDTISINNLLKVDSPLGYLVVSVEKNGTLKSVDFNYSKGRAVVITKSSEIFFDSGNSWEFLGVLYADSYTYNPVTGHLLVNLSNTNDTGLVLSLGEGKDHPVMAYASNTVESLLYDSLSKKYSSYVKSGTYRFLSSDEPFAVVFNDSALRAGQDYTTDEFNFTTVTVNSDGFLDVYYSNPTNVSLELASDSIKLYVATPYGFNGKVHYVVKKYNQSIEDRVVSFRANPPLTVVSIKPAVSGDVRITVYDTDSDKVIYSTEVQKVLPDYNLFLLSLFSVIVVIALIYAILKTGKEKAKAKMEKDWRFFKKIK